MSYVDNTIRLPSRLPSAVPAPRRTGLKIIAIYEVIKTLCMVVLALAAFQLDHAQNFHHFLHWLAHLPLTGSSELRWELVNGLVAFGPSKFTAVGIVTLGYAAIFAVEGVGLWLGKHWAEWFTVIATGSLIPLELYETLHGFGWIKLAVLIGNVLIIIYLVRIARQPRCISEILQTS